MWPAVAYYPEANAWPELQGGDGGRGSLTSAWRRGAPMPGPRRSFFVCATVGGAGLLPGGGCVDDGGAAWWQLRLGSGDGKGSERTDDAVHTSCAGRWRIR
ncbi:hypothetical protein BS78_02G276500 [Paspalum vaginatum]|nr:hypothetical protein BS78_02G276500 [Paspalum vaginatum]